MILLYLLWLWIRAHICYYIFLCLNICCCLSTVLYNSCSTFETTHELHNSVFAILERTTCEWACIEGLGVWVDWQNRRRYRHQNVCVYRHSAHIVQENRMKLIAVRSAICTKRSGSATVVAICCSLRLMVKCIF